MTVQDASFDGTVAEAASRRMTDQAIRLDEDARVRMDDFDDLDSAAQRGRLEGRLVLITEAILELVAIKRQAYTAIAALPRGVATAAIVDAFAAREQSTVPTTLFTLPNTISRAERKQMAKGKELDDIQAWWVLNHTAQELIDGHEEARASLSADLNDLAFLESMAAPDVEPRSTRDRLIELDALHDDGLVTDEEYIAKREQILDEL